MPRNMSFALTTQQILDQTKTVTRRKFTKAAARGRGWVALQTGEKVWAVEKAMGLKKGEKVNRLALIEIVDVRVEQLEMGMAYERGCMTKEGFPQWEHDHRSFIEMFLEANGGNKNQDVIRIEFKHLESA